jgi:hypothetical protein
MDLPETGAVCFRLHRDRPVMLPRKARNPKIIDKQSEVAPPPHAGFALSMHPENHGPSAFPEKMQEAEKQSTSSTQSAQMRQG